jgi:hypothetical protein
MDDDGIGKSSVHKSLHPFKKVTAPLIMPTSEVIGLPASTVVGKQFGDNLIIVMAY